MPVSATYQHLDPPVAIDGGFNNILRLRVTFADVPQGLNGDTLEDQVFEHMYRAQPNEETGEYAVIWPPSDGSTDLERAHRGAQNAVRIVAVGRGFQVDFDDIAYVPS